MHDSLELENWKKVGTKFSYNFRSDYYELDIDAIKFYFFLKEIFGIPNANYSSVAEYFPTKRFHIEKRWCYSFQVETDTILITGEKKINIVVFSLTSVPNELDFELFKLKINKILDTFSIQKYNNNIFEVYINYSFYLNNLILQYKDKIQSKLPKKPKILSPLRKDYNTDNPEILYSYIENSHDYNHWFKAVLDKAHYSLQIQILLPIYFESLVSLAFRVKLKREYYNDNVKYGEIKYPINIFEYFETLSLPKKIEFIEQKCFEINIDKMNCFRQRIRSDYSLRDKRNKILHGNALFFQNINLKYYLDEGYLIGFPDRGNLMSSIASSISVSVENTNLKNTIKSYEDLCNQFVDIFDDNGYFKRLIEGISFAYNPTKGGTISIGVKTYDDLFAPKEFE